MRWANLLVMGFLGVLPFTGCSSTASVGAIQATGTVTYDGKPLEGATVAFVPEGDGGRNASGLTDASGNFRLTTVVPGDGAVPGKYKIAVSKVSQATETQMPKSREEAEKQIKEKMQAGGGTGGYSYPGAGGNQVKEELPPRYANPTTSGLSAEVKSGGDNKFNFALTTSG